jgi:hypothetical protein
MQSQQVQSAALGSSSVGGGDGRSACQTSLGRAPVGFRIARPFGFVGDDATLGHAFGLTSAATGDAAQIGSGRRRVELLGRRRECDALLVAHVAQSRKWHRPNGWRQHDLTDGAMIGLEKLSEARAYLRFGSSVWCHRDASRTLLSRVSPTTGLLVAV